LYGKPQLLSARGEPVEPPFDKLRVSGAGRNYHYVFLCNQVLAYLTLLFVARDLPIIIRIALYGEAQ
jgi:hypothetical protein